MSEAPDWTNCSACRVPGCHALDTVCAICGTRPESPEPPGNFAEVLLREALVLLVDEHLAYAGNPTAGDRWVARRAALIQLMSKAR